MTASAWSPRAGAPRRAPSRRTPRDRASARGGASPRSSCRLPASRRRRSGTCPSAETTRWTGPAAIRSMPNAPLASVSARTVAPPSRQEAKARRRLEDERTCRRERRRIEPLVAGRARHACAGDRALAIDVELELHPRARRRAGRTTTRRAARTRPPPVRAGREGIASRGRSRARMRGRPAPTRASDSPFRRRRAADRSNESSISRSASRTARGPSAARAASRACAPHGRGRSHCRSSGRRPCSRPRRRAPPW